MLTVSQAAKRLVNRRTGERGVSRQRVNAMISSGILVAQKNEHGLYLIEPREVTRVNRLERKMGRPCGENPHS